MLPIPLAWIVALTTAAYCWYNNDGTTYKPLYGALYNWFAVNTGNLCPTGWHVPSDAEFSTLELYLGMSPADITGLWIWMVPDQAGYSDEEYYRMGCRTKWNQTQAVFRPSREVTVMV